MMEYCVEETLRDGSPVIVRAIKPEDKPALQNGLDRLSRESTYSRFFYAKRQFSERELKFLTELDFERHVAIGVGLLEGGDMLPIGIGRYIVEDKSKRAEVAFTVADEFQGIGVGSLLLQHLVVVARENGIQEFFATTLVTNQKMLGVFERSRLPMQKRLSGGVVEITISLDQS